jgi:hypothetical protein
MFTDGSDEPVRGRWGSSARTGGQSKKQKKGSWASARRFDNQMRQHVEEVVVEADLMERGCRLYTKDRAVVR